MGVRKVSLSPLLGKSPPWWDNTCRPAQESHPGFAPHFPAIQTIKRLAGHLSHPIDWIEWATYSRSDLSYFQAAITATSRALHSSLEREVYLDRVTIEVPHTWTEMDCRTPLSMACLTPTSRKVNFFGQFFWCVMVTTVEAKIFKESADQGQILKILQ